MNYTTLISSHSLLGHLPDPDLAIIDCRFDLENPDAGLRAYQEAHIPGAIYAHLEQDLSAPMTGRNGRHPLPAEETLAELFSSWGINPDVQVVAYDARGGGFAARLWWSLRYLGHEKAAILDGGYPAWESAGFVTEVGDQARPRREFQPHPRPEMLVTSPELRELLEQPGLLVIDSRAPERYRGEEEPYDPVAGHVPGAANHFWQSNLTPDGSLLTKEELHRRFTALLGNIPPEKSIFYCGSGVTACHNLLAMSHAGLPTPRLYAGSWSEWCADPQNPVATGGSASRTSEQTEAHT